MTRRARAYGRWAPFVDADPVRDHITTLRATGIGIDQIAKLAALSPSHVRQLVYHSRTGRPVTQRVRPATCDRILAVTVDAADHAASQLLDATGTRRRLQALTAAGWAPAQLAAKLQRSTSSLNRTMTRARVRTTTADSVHALFGELWDQLPPANTPAQRSSILRMRALAAERHWSPALAWDDIDKDPYPPTVPPVDPSDIDEIAIERALGCDGIRLRDLNPREQVLVVNRLTVGGASLRDISDRLASTTRTVSRRRNPGAA